MLPTIEIDATAFCTLEEFFQHFEERALDGSPWGWNLDGLNDVLRGGFGSPEEGFRLVWRAHALSRERLGYPETVRQLQLRLEQCHPDSRSIVQRDLALALSNRGDTVFDAVVDIIREHGPGGVEARDNVHLVLA